MSKIIVNFICAITIGIFAIPSISYAQIDNSSALNGEKAIEQLKRDGSYESLKQAVESARQNSGQTTGRNYFVNSRLSKMSASDGATNDHFGESVAINGETAIVGSYWDDVGATVNQGSAYVFVRNGATWTQQAQLTASDGAAGDCFGRSVAIDGDYVVVGAYLDDNTGVDQGSVYVFFRSTANVWSEQQKLTASDGAAFDYFGESVSISGNTVIAGAQHDLIGTSADQGSAHIFTRTGTAWNETQKLTAADGSADDRFGFSVALSGDTVVVGAYLDDVGGNLNQGSAYVFVRNSGLWTQQQQLFSSDGLASDNFGISVAISGDTAVVGAWAHDGDVADQGAAYIFDRAGSTWTQSQELNASDGGVSDYFGHSVSISDNKLIVGAYVDDVGGNLNQGSAYVFVRREAKWSQLWRLNSTDGVTDDQFAWSVGISGDTAIVGARSVDVGGNFEQGSVFAVKISTGWKDESKTLPFDPGGGDRFGISVAISGNTAIVGAAGDTVGSFSGAGSAYIFVRSGKVWSEQFKLTASDRAMGDIFGISVSIDRDTAIVGAWQDDIGGNANQGSAYVFVRNGTNWSQQAKLTASDGVFGDGFGNSVGISGDTAVVAALYNDVGSNVNQGSVYVFTRSGTTWTEQTQLISSDGAAVDVFGYNVAIKGDTVIVGAPFHEIGPSGDQGAAYVFVGSGSTWSQQAYLTSSDGAPGDFFGYGVAINRDTAVVGAMGADNGSIANQGTAYVFIRSGTSWSHQARLNAPDGVTGDGFGTSVAVSGNTAIVGALYDSASSHSQQGSAYVFVRNRTRWTNHTKLIAPDGTQGDSLGYSVAISGQTVLSGAPLETLLFNEQGSAYFFRLNQALCDFDGDGKSDASVGRPDFVETKLSWFLEDVAANDMTVVDWGLDTDYLAPADYDGDGFTDFAVFRGGALGYFHIMNSSDHSVRNEQFGQDGDVLMFGDWDGDGRADPAVYRDSAYGTQSYFFYRGSMDNPNGDETYVPWGIAGDKPMRGDFDGDGKMDAAVFRPSDNTWYIRQSSDGQIRYESWGLSTDKFVPADYDGDGRTDLAVFRDGTWFIRQSSDGQLRAVYFGLATDTLVPADYDEDGKTDLAVFRDGDWYILFSSDGQLNGGQWGLAGDKPAPASYMP